MKNLNILFVFFIMLLAACSPHFIVNSDRDTSVNLRNYETFAVAMNNEKNDSDPILNSDLNRKRIAAAIRSNLTGKGYLEAEKSPDVIVNFYTRVKDKQEVQDFNNGAWGYWWWSRNNNYVRNYEESTLIIDMVDAKSKQLVWQGWAVGELNYRNLDKMMSEGIADIFKNYPSRLPDNQSTTTRR